MIGRHVSTGLILSIAIAIVVFLAHIPQSRPRGGWTSAINDGLATAKVMAIDQKGQFGAICAPGNCMFYMDYELSCTPEAPSRMLMNAGGDVLAVEASCQTMEIHAQERSVAAFQLSSYTHWIFSPRRSRVVEVVFADFEGRVQTAQFRTKGFMRASLIIASASRMTPANAHVQNPLRLSGRHFIVVNDPPG